MDGNLHLGPFRRWPGRVEQRLRCALLQRVARGEQVVLEYRMRRPLDGKVRWLRDTDFLMRGADGQVRHIGGVGHDISAMKEAEEALAAAEQRQRLLLEGIPQLSGARSAMAIGPGRAHNGPNAPG